jgi:hypothetical protein
VLPPPTWGQAAISYPKVEEVSHKFL